MEEIKQKAAQKRLESYLWYRKIVENNCRSESELIDEMALRASMFAIRRSVMRLPDCPEKLLLYNHYIRGETLEACAELAGISRRTVFRLKIRAIELYINCNPEGENVRVLS